MVCVPCIVIPVLLYIWHRWLYPGPYVILLWQINQVAAANCPEDLESLGQGFHQLHSLMCQLSTLLNHFQRTTLFAIFPAKV